jgi:hypothetical protein
VLDEEDDNDVIECARSAVVDKYDNDDAENDEGEFDDDNEGDGNENDNDDVVRVKFDD